jgi:hypothetical protein
LASLAFKLTVELPDKSTIIALLSDAQTYSKIWGVVVALGFKKATLFDIIYNINIHFFFEKLCMKIFLIKYFLY